MKIDKTDDRLQIVHTSGTQNPMIRNNAEEIKIMIKHSDSKQTVPRHRYKPTTAFEIIFLSCLFNSLDTTRDRYFVHWFLRLDMKHS